MSIPSRPPAIRLTALLPDFRNQGIWLRLLLAANGLMLAATLAGSRGFAHWQAELVETAALVEPALLLTLAMLYLLSPLLQGLPPRFAAMLVTVLAMAATGGVDLLLSQALGGAGGGWRAILAAGAAMLLLLYWLDLRARAYAPSLAEARLSALTARIRPHFFFNSLNAVLGLMREDPRRAETALEELADLFRVLMRDNRELTPLSEEIGLARKYLDIERLRLGERLQARWEVAEDLPETLVPPLLLQPLLENAVYHGIEPAMQPGEIRICIAGTRDGVRIEIDNPWFAAAEHRHGNRMALENLRERLMLFFDLEARLDTVVEDGRYRVRVDLPRQRSA